ncbi:MAG TPA: hypothetical protein VF520_04595 [Thermoleophilaceae bacterium]
MRGRVLAATAAAVLGVAAASVPPPAGAAKAKYPRVEQLVAFRDGSALERAATAKKATVRVGGRDCAAGTGTPLAALARIDPPKLRLRDYGSCSRSPADGAGLFVRRIGGDSNRGVDGWVYKVGSKIATAGAADPSGPFGRGRLRDGARVTWFYCRLDTRTRSCQRTLAVRVEPAGPGRAAVHVRAHDDRGRSVPAEGATVRSGDVTATADADGEAVLQLPPGRHRVHAERSGDVRSFSEEVDVG